jgi:HTH-type transcriptional regulator/antitoxin HipB
VLDAARIVRERRHANGLSQARLARRAGTAQAAISRIERGQVSPTVAMLERLLYVMGEELDATVRRMHVDVDPGQLGGTARPAAR